MVLVQWLTPAQDPESPVDGQRSATSQLQPGSTDAESDTPLTADDDGRMVHLAGHVNKLLADDNNGSRHQRFLFTTEAGQRLLVAHNIDLAPRIDALQAGERIALHGQFEWNDRGGVIHWTHHAPRGDHIGGWIEHRGRRYE